MAPKRNLSQRAINRILKMIDHVARDKKSYDQDEFPNYLFQPECRSEYCAAGHLIMASNPKLFKQIVASKSYDRDVAVPSPNWGEEALKLLGIDELIGIRRALFGPASDWPHKFSKRYYGAKTALGRFSAFKAYWLKVIELDADYDKLFEQD